MSTLSAATALELSGRRGSVDLVDCAARYRQITWRLMPVLIISCVVNAIDRGNISMAQLRMEKVLSFSAEIYVVGVGIFDIGYVMFEVPSNMLLERIGIRRTFLRIMTAWGVASTCTMFATTPTQFCEEVRKGMIV